MNHIYRVIFNHQTGTFQAVAETAKSVHKTSRGKYAKVFKAFLTPISLALSLAFGFAAHASPTGGQVTAGVANIAQTGTITNINQSSQNAAINWQSFNVGKNETVNFNQPNAQSVTLNRVIGNERSVIDGAMNANGKVFISNANGMLIGKDAKINVGSLVATTANISDDDLMNGRYQFTGERAGSIENLGQISVPKGGVVALVAPIVKNGGTITAHDGNVLLASAESFSITLPDNANFAYTLDKGTLQGLVDNGGAILADGGRVVLTAKGVDTVKKSLIKHTGAIEANTVSNNNGVIELLGDLDNSALNVSGSLKAEAKESGDGGFIETSASQVKIEDSAEVSTLAENGKTGTWLIDPTDFVIYQGAGEQTKNSIGADTLATNLKNNNVVIQTVATGSEKGNINVNAPVSWSKNRLTLSAHNDIYINETLNGNGTAKLALEYGGDYYLDKYTPLKDRNVKINLPKGKNLTLNGGVFDVIHEMPDIIRSGGEWSSRFDTQNIALGRDIDVGYTRNYDGFAGWEFPNDRGTVVGLGHKVSNLTLRNDDDNKNIGLFQQTQQEGWWSASEYIRDIALIGANIHANGENSRIGGIVGSGDNISNSYVTGVMSGTGTGMKIGGLVGEGGNISNSYATVNVSSTGDSSFVGGLVGYGGGISNSYAIGTVSSIGDSYVGGLVGGTGTLSNSYAAVNVSSTGDGSSVGGLVGYGYNISNSYAIGAVSSTGIYTHTGGLVGTGSGISNSYANNAKFSAVGNRRGGILGYYQSAETSFGNSFFNQSRYPNLPAIGGRADGINLPTLNAIGKSEYELENRSTFNGWDFDNIWYMDGDTPKLRAFRATSRPNIVPIKPNIDKEKPKSLVNINNQFCKSLQECKTKGIEWYKSEKERYDDYAKQLIAENKREKLFYIENPFLRKSEFDNYIDEMYRASQNPEYVANQYLQGFPEDLKVSASYDLNLRDYLNKVIQYHHLINLQNQYNSELNRFGKHIDGTVLGDTVQNIASEMINLQTQAGNLPKNQDYSIFLENVHMASDLWDFTISGAQLASNFVPSIEALEQAVGSMETAKEVYHTAKAAPKALSIGKNSVILGKDLVEKMSKGEDISGVTDQVIDLLSDTIEVMGGDDNKAYKSAKVVYSIKKAHDNVADIKQRQKSIEIIKSIPDNILPADFKKSAISNINANMVYSTMELIENIVGTASVLPGMDTLKDTQASFKTAFAAFTNMSTRETGRFYIDNLNKINYANPLYQQALFYRAEAIRTMIK